MTETVQIISAIIGALAAVAAWKAANASKKSSDILRTQNDREIEPQIFINCKRFVYKHYFGNCWETEDGEMVENVGSFEDRRFSPYFIEIYNLGRNFAKEVGVYFETEQSNKLFEYKTDFKRYKIDLSHSNGGLNYYSVYDKRFERETIVEVTSDGTQLKNFLLPYSQSNEVFRVKLPYKFVLPIEMMMKNFFVEDVLERMEINDELSYTATIVLIYKNMNGREYKKKFRIKLDGYETRSGSGKFGIIEL